MCSKKSKQKPKGEESEKEGERREYLRACSKARLGLLRQLKFSAARSSNEGEAAGKATGFGSDSGGSSWEWVR